MVSVREARPYRAPMGAEPLLWNRPPLDHLGYFPDPQAGPHPKPSDRQNHLERAKDSFRSTMAIARTTNLSDSQQLAVRLGAKWRPSPAA